MQTPVCDLLGIDVPIVLASFGPWEQVELAAAVSNAGGLGSVGPGSSPTPAPVAATIGFRSPASRSGWRITSLPPPTSCRG